MRTPARPACGDLRRPAPGRSHRLSAPRARAARPPAPAPARRAAPSPACASFGVTRSSRSSSRVRSASPSSTAFTVASRAHLHRARELARRACRRIGSTSSAAAHEPGRHPGVAPRYQRSKPTGSRFLSVCARRSNRPSARFMRVPVALAQRHPPRRAPGGTSPGSRPSRAHRQGATLIDAARRLVEPGPADDRQRPSRGRRVGRARTPSWRSASARRAPRSGPRVSGSTRDRRGTPSSRPARSNARPHPWAATSAFRSASRSPSRGSPRPAHRGVDPQAHARGHADLAHAPIEATARLGVPEEQPQALHPRERVEQLGARVPRHRLVGETLEHLLREQLGRARSPFAHVTIIWAICTSSVAGAPRRPARPRSAASRAGRRPASRTFVNRPARSGQRTTSFARSSSASTSACASSSRKQRLVGRERHQLGRRERQRPRQPIRAIERPPLTHMPAARPARATRRPLRRPRAPPRAPAGTTGSRTRAGPAPCRSAPRSPRGGAPSCARSCGFGGGKSASTLALTSSSLSYAYPVACSR